MGRNRGRGEREGVAGMRREGQDIGKRKGGRRGGREAEGEHGRKERWRGRGGGRRKDGTGCAARALPRASLENCWCLPKGVG